MRIQNALTKILTLCIVLVPKKIEAYILIQVLLFDPE